MEGDVWEAEARGVVTGCAGRHGDIQGDSSPCLGGLGVGAFPEALTKQLPIFASWTSEITWALLPPVDEPARTESMQ